MGGIIISLCFVFLYKIGNGQVGYPIWQPKVIVQVFANKFSRERHIGLLRSTLQKTKQYKEKTLTAWAVVEEVNKKIYKNLTNVESGIRNGKMMVSITKRIPEIIENVTEAGKIAAGKPYLIKIWNTTGRTLVDRSMRLYNDITSIVLSADKDMLINQARRDEILWRVYRQIKIIYNISQTLVYEFKWYTLQIAINEIFPYKYYINLDKNIVNQTINRFKF